MAKTKKKKKEKVIDLKKSVTHVTAEDLKKLQDIAAKFDRAHQEMGMMENRKSQIINVIREWEKDLEGLKADITEKYGNCDIDLKTGELKKADQQNPTNGQVDKKD